MTTITDERYKDPKSIPLVFRFCPEFLGDIHHRMEKCSIQNISIEGKDLYLIDRFFTPNEAQEMRQFSNTATFSREIFASSDSKQGGQKPTSSMNSKEKWAFFANPPKAVQEFYNLLSVLSHQLDADITTFPWDLFHGNMCSPAVNTNQIREHSKENMELDKHKDADPQDKGIAFGIPILYEKEKAYFPKNFVNGAPGKPWLVTAMLYSTAENFLPEYGMGTVFYKSCGERAFRAECLHTRLVLFEVDIIHGVESSSLPQDVSTERISYVFKLTFNPRKQDQSVKQNFSRLVVNSL